jgi:ubiquitin C
MSLNSFPLEIKSPSGHVFTFDIETGTTIGQIKQLMYVQEGYPVEQQKLVASGQGELEDTERFDDIRSIRRIQMNGPLNLLIRRTDARRHAARSPRDEPSTVFIKTLSGKTISIEIQEGSTVAQAKQQISKIERIPIESQILIFMQTVLNDDQKFIGYLFKTVSNEGLHLVIRDPDLPPLLPDREPAAARPDPSFETCMAYMALSRELRRLNADGKTHHALVKALVNIELRHLEDPSQARITFDFERLQPEEKDDENTEEAEVRRVRDQIFSLEQMVVNRWARSRDVAPQLQAANLELQANILARNNMYIVIARNELDPAYYSNIIALLDRYITR